MQLYCIEVEAEEESDLPYCDAISVGSCFDRQDRSDDSGLYSCKDRSEVEDPGDYD
jgi:hypothetical protein